MPIQEVFSGDARALILRTSWVMGPVGRNFALTMLRLHRERDTLGVVADQVGCPSSTLNLAQACWQCIRLGSTRKRCRRSCTGATPVQPAGTTSPSPSENWAANWGLLASPAEVNPISTSDYPTPAERPSYSLARLQGNPRGPASQR